MAMSAMTFQTLFPMLNVITPDLFFKVAIGWLIFWILLEVIFWYIIEYLILPKLQQFKKPFPIDQCHPVDFIKKILNLVDSLDSYDIKRFVEGFFHFAPLDQIYKDNLRSFLCWAMFGKCLEQINEQDKEHLHEIFTHLEERYEEMRNLKPGYNPNVSHCSFTLEPIRHLHRPLALYIGAGLLEFTFNVIFFRFSGYQSLELGGLTYWIKQGSSSDAAPPVLIFHGISPGWSLYGLLVKYMETNRTVILIDFDSVKIKSMKFVQPPINQFVRTVSAILKRHQIKKVSLVGHSFGSITAGWIASRIPESVSHLTLLDPVSLLLAFPDVPYSFLYKKPETIFDWVIYLGAAKEITVAHSLYRNFCWHKNILWLEDIAEHIGVVVGIGSHDEIANMHAVGEYVRKCSEKRKKSTNSNVAEITCVEWKGYHHGQVLVSHQTLAQFLSVVKASEKAVGFTN